MGDVSRALREPRSLATMSIQLAPGLVIADRFRLNHELARGGMGSVWHATHLGLDMPCAVKFIEGELSLTAEAHARFEREAKAAAHLRSPHVVQILDHGVWRETPYIAMELLVGEELGRRLRRVSRLAPWEVLQIVSPICRALTRAHTLGIVHRDLKPDNVFLVRDDDREIPKVLDFGIAKATAPGFDAGHTRTGVLLGTPYYMSPEQAQGIASIDARSDLWSLAVIVFQMLTGVLPFESEALGDLLVKIIVSPVPMPSRFASDLPVDFDHWWTKASQRDPAQRFQTAREFDESLARALRHTPTPQLPVATAAVRFASPPSPMVGRPPAQSSFAAVPDTKAPMSRTPAPAPAPFATSSAPRPRRRPVKAAGAAAVLALALATASFVLKTKRAGVALVGVQLGGSAVPTAPAPAQDFAPSPVAARVPAEASLSTVSASAADGAAAAPLTAIAGPGVLPAKPHATGSAVQLPPVPAAKSAAVPAAPTPAIPTAKRKTVDLGI